MNLQQRVQLLLKYTTQCHGNEFDFSLPWRLKGAVFWLCMSLDTLSLNGIIRSIFRSIHSNRWITILSNIPNSPWYILNATTSCYFNCLQFQFFMQQFQFFDERQLSISIVRSNTQSERRLATTMDWITSLLAWTVSLMA